MINKAILPACLSGLILSACGCPQTKLVLDPKLLEKAKAQGWEKEGPQVEAQRYLVVPQPINAPGLRALFADLKLPPAEKWRPQACGKDQVSYSVKEGSVTAFYTPSTSELDYVDTAVAELKPQEFDGQQPDVQGLSQALLKKTAPSLAGDFRFTNIEKVSKQEKDAKE